MDGRAEAQRFFHRPFRGCFISKKLGRSEAAFENDPNRIADLMHRRFMACIEQHDCRRNQLVVGKVLAPP
ncbi:hypothetical protein D3C71_2152120 [compost metagenome]